MAAADTKIYIGGTFSNGTITGYQLVFDPQDYSDVSDVRSVTMDGQKLQVDELYVHLHVQSTTANKIKGNDLQGKSQKAVGAYWFSVLSGIQYGTPVWYTHKYADGTTSVRKYYWKRLERGTAGACEFDLIAQSDIGILDGVYSDGGLYTGATFATVLSELIGKIISYTVDPKIACMTVYGWLPAQSQGTRHTVRTNLHALVLAFGVAVRRDAEQNLYFTSFPTEAKTLDDSAIFQGMSAPLGESVSKVEVMEYQFLQTATDDTVTLFDNTKGGGVAKSEKVFFDAAPVHHLQALGELRIEKEHVNYAIVSGTGILTGKPYTMVSRIVTEQGSNNASIENIENVASISGVYVINPLNSEAVAMRVRDIECAAQTMEMDILRKGEDPGDLVSFTDLYGDPVSGYLISMEGNVTSFERAQCKILCGYTPQYSGNLYERMETLIGSGTWTVPADLDGSRVRVTLISGGQGGASGCHGTDDKGTGGEGGQPGIGGKILTVELETVHAGEQYPYVCGAGGAGGQASDEPNAEGQYISVPGTLGGATTFGTYSSDKGGTSTNGFQQLTLSVTYALSGDSAGLPGGAAATGKEDSTTLLDAPRGSRVFAHTNPNYPEVICPWNDPTGSPVVYSAGQIGSSLWEQSDYDGEQISKAWGFGGMGGGAAVGANGEDGGNSDEGIGGAGGNGADARMLFPNPVRHWGCGGWGGHGGGAGGQGGTGHVSQSSKLKAKDGKNGAGGKGSNGQDGMPGCIVLCF